MDTVHDEHPYREIARVVRPKFQAEVIDHVPLCDQVRIR